MLATVDVDRLLVRKLNLWYHIVAMEMEKMKKKLKLKKGNWKK